MLPIMSCIAHVDDAILVSDALAAGIYNSRSRRLMRLATISRHAWHVSATSPTQSRMPASMAINSMSAGSQTDERSEI